MHNERHFMATPFWPLISGCRFVTKYSIYHSRTMFQHTVTQRAIIRSWLSVKRDRNTGFVRLLNHRGTIFVGWCFVTSVIVAYRQLVDPCPGRYWSPANPATSVHPNPPMIQFYCGELSWSQAQNQIALADLVDRLATQLAEIGRERTLDRVVQVQQHGSFYRALGR